MEEARERELLRAHCAPALLGGLEHEHLSTGSGRRIAAASPFGPLPMTIASII